jgi:hypothetical protein
MTGQGWKPSHRKWTTYILHQWQFSAVAMVNGMVEEGDEGLNIFLRTEAITSTV